MKRYVKTANDPTFYLAEDDKPARPISSQAEMHRIGMLPVEVVSETELERLRSEKQSEAPARRTRSRKKAETVEEAE